TIIFGTFIPEIALCCPKIFLRTPFFSLKGSFLPIDHQVLFRCHCVLLSLSLAVSFSCCLLLSLVDLLSLVVSFSCYLFLLLSLIVPCCLFLLLSLVSMSTLLVSRCTSNIQPRQ
ncbi:hypothetical protein ACN38_g11314, partial [Penicillium nordicum]